MGRATVRHPISGSYSRRPVLQAQMPSRSRESRSSRTRAQWAGSEAAGLTTAFSTSLPALALSTVDSESVGPGQPEAGVPSIAGLRSCSAGRRRLRFSAEIDLIGLVDQVGAVLSVSREPAQQSRPEVAARVDLTGGHRRADPGSKIARSTPR